MGTVIEIDDDGMEVSVLFDDDRMVVYDYSILDELEPSFAVTIHKSQGSEFPVVVMPIFPGPEVLMTRNLLYTAVTYGRGKWWSLWGTKISCSGWLETKERPYVIPVSRTS